ncbi:unnamed protein product [Absidia cylindrospora]
MPSFITGFVKYCKRSVSPTHVTEQDDQAVTRIPTNSSTTSSDDSHLDLYKCFSKHLNDPMRISDRPDMVGQFHDPMSIGKKHSSLVGHDVTHTGA